MRALRSIPAVRAVGLPLYRAAARARAGAPPRVLANGVPKSGTHLLTALLRELPDMRFSGEHLAPYDLYEGGTLESNRLERRLRRVRDGQYASSHLPAAPEIVSAVTRLGYRSVFIIRDPRDLVVSDLYYILRNSRHPLYSTMHRIATSSGRLAALIEGLPARAAPSGLLLMPSIGERLAAFAGWLTAPRTKVTRFEDLVGPAGGGDAAAQRREIAAVADHLDRSLRPEEVARVAGRIWSPRSSTFRRGAIGDWRNEFTPVHRELFKRSAGAQLLALGYERDGNW
jgi:hypothetical protein